MSFLELEDPVLEGVPPFLAALPPVFELEPDFLVVVGLEDLRLLETLLGLEPCLAPEA